MPSLPSSLEPYMWSSDGYSISKAINNNRAEKFSGIARQRMMSPAYSDEITGSFVIPNDELAVWETFYEAEIDDGAGVFDCPIGDGFGMRTLAVRIKGGSYRKERFGYSNWRISLTVVCDQRLVEYPGQLDSIIELGRELNLETGNLIDHNGDPFIDHTGDNIIYEERS